MSALTILIVEDNPEAQDTLVEYLTPDFKVVVAGDGAQGLAIASTLKPTVILVDLVMPELDGLSLCRALRAREGTQLTPIIAMSGGGDIDKWHEAISAGANDFIPKPFRQHELLTRIQEQIGPSWI